MNKEQRQYTIEAHFFIENDFLDVADLLRELREDIAHGLNKNGVDLDDKTKVFDSIWYNQAHNIT